MDASSAGLQAIASPPTGHYAFVCVCVCACTFVGHHFDVNGKEEKDVKSKGILVQGFRISLDEEYIRYAPYKECTCSSFQ